MAGQDYKNMDYFLNAIKHKYATFSGRARRKEYWMFFLFYVIFNIILSILDGVLGLKGHGQYNVGVLNSIYGLVLLIPSLAIAVRRLHDTDRSGWWLLIILVPIVGAIVFIVFLCLDSTPGSNKYGPNPKENTPPTPGIPIPNPVS